MNHAGPRRSLSPSGRRKIAAAQRLRWARVRAQNVVSIAKGPKPGKRTMSASARRKIAAAQRARWAKVNERPSSLLVHEWIRVTQFHVSEDGASIKRIGDLPRMLTEPEMLPSICLFLRKNRFRVSRQVSSVTEHGIDIEAFTPDGKRRVSIEIKGEDKFFGAQVEISLATMVYNLKRMLNVLGGKQLQAALNS